MKKYLLIVILIALKNLSFADDGSRLWLKYDLIKNIQQREQNAKLLKFISVNNLKSETISKASNELKTGIEGLFGKKVAIITEDKNQTGGIIFEVSDKQTLTQNLADGSFAIFVKGGNIVISSKTDVGILYGSFELLRKIQTGQSLSNISILSSPKNKNPNVEPLG